MWKWWRSCRDTQKESGLEQRLKGVLLLFIGSLVAGNKAEHKRGAVDATPPPLPQQPELASIQRGPAITKVSDLQNVDPGHDIYRLTIWGHRPRQTARPPNNSCCALVCI